MWNRPPSLQPSAAQCWVVSQASPDQLPQLDADKHFKGAGKLLSLVSHATSCAAMNSLFVMDMPLYLCSNLAPGAMLCGLLQ